MAKSSFDVVDRPAPAEEPVDNGSDVRKVMEDTLTWSPEEERRALRKLDIYLMPLLFAGFFVLQLDRSNISNAMTDTITQDLNITKNDVNAGKQLMLAGIVIAEIPSNLVLQRVGAPRWLTFQMFAWGLIALFQAWCTNLSSFMATRFLLGFFEAGYIPGGQYLLALFYTRQELALRTAIFYFGNYGATATGSLIAAGILRMGGVLGYSGWQWLFIIEGAITLLVFVGFVMLCPTSPSNTRPVHGMFDFFTDRDREILTARITRDDGSKGAAKAKITFKTFMEAIGDYRLWLHMILNMVALAPKGGLQLYGPTIIKNLGFSKTNANLLNSVSSFLVIILSALISFASDKTRWRGPWCIVAYIYAIVFAGALFGLPESASKWTYYAVFTMLAGGNAVAQGLNDAWLSINAVRPANRSLGLAMVVMGSNLGGLAGSQLFRDEDAPKYEKGFLGVLLLYASCFPITLTLMWVYQRANRKLAQGKELKVSGQIVEAPEDGKKRFDL